MKVYLPGNRLRHRFNFSILFFLLALTDTQAQYCSPTVATGGIYFSYINFAYGGDIAGGVTYSPTSGGYSQTVGSSSGTILRYYGGVMNYDIYNPTASSKPYFFAMFADWNNDGVFGANELIFSTSGTLAPNSSTGTDPGFAPPLTALSGSVRIRFAVSQSSAPAACGTFTGAVRDYILTIPVNTAPVLNTSGTPFLDPLLTTQTTNNGISVGALVSSTIPNQVLIADPDDMSAGSPVPRGIAIFGQSAPNGVWQYQVSGGSWTNFGAVSTSNSLLLVGDPSIPRVRFVPSAAGTPSFSYRAWDGTSAVSGSFGSSTGTGGATAFSTSIGTAGLTVYAPTSLASGSVYFASDVASSLFSSSIDLVNGIINEAAPFPAAANSLDYAASDIAYDPVSTKLYWLSPYSSLSIPQIFSSNSDGTGKATVISLGASDYVAGLTAGDGKVFYGDNSGTTMSIFSVNPNGTGNTKISGTGKISETDITANGIASMKFNNNKIFIASPDAIIVADTNGSASSVIYSAASNAITGLSATADTLYWTENDPTNTTGYVKKVPTVGGTAATIVSQSGPTGNYGYSGLVADSSHSTIYVVSSYSYPQGLNSLTGVKKVSMGGGSVTNVVQADTGQFYMAFNTIAVILPVTLTSLTAYQKGQDVDVEWKTQEEQGVQRYDVERSADATLFAQIGKVTATGLSDYIFTDLHPLTGNNFYRLNIVDIDGNSRSSPIVSVNITPGGQSISLYPNPWVNHAATLEFSNMLAGQYQVGVFTATGRQVYSLRISYTGGSLGQTLLLPAAFVPGIYNLQVRNPAGQPVYVNSFVLQ
jgi:hypothetical protein